MCSLHIPLVGMNRNSLKLTCNTFLYLPTQWNMASPWDEYVFLSTAMPCRIYELLKLIQNFQKGFFFLLFTSSVVFQTLPVDTRSNPLNIFIVRVQKYARYIAYGGNRGAEEYHGTCLLRVKEVEKIMQGLRWCRPCMCSTLVQS